MHVFILCGSISENSKTRILMEQSVFFLEELGHQVTFEDLRYSALPMADPAFHANPEMHPDIKVTDFISRFKAADAYLVGSPLYHGSISGVLKNALDHLWYDAFRDKPVGIISYGSSPHRCAFPCITLNTIIKTMYGYPLQTEVAASKADLIENIDGDVYFSETVICRVKRQLHEMVNIHRSLSLS